MADKAEDRQARIEEAVENLNTVLEEAYKAGHSVRVGLMPSVRMGKRRDDQNLVTIG